MNFEFGRRCDTSGSGAEPQILYIDSLRFISLYRQSSVHIS